MPTGVLSANTGADVGGSVDCWLEELSNTVNHSGGATNTVGNWDTGDHKRTICVFPTAGFPGAGSLTVSGASLDLWLSSDPSGSPTSDACSVWEVLRAVVVGQATWNIYSTGNSWATAGGKGTGDITATAVATGNLGTTTGQYYSFTGAALDALVQTYINAGNPIRLLVGYTTEGAGANKEKNVAGAAGTNGQRPRLTFTYTAGGSADESITKTPIGSISSDAPDDDGMAALLALFNQQVTLGQVNDTPALWSPMLFMADPPPADDVDLWIDILQAIQDAPAGDATVTGQLITAVASLLAGAAQADSQVSGQTITATASLLAGAAQAGSSVAGQTMSTSASILPGSVTADSSVAAQTLTATASIVPGAAQASSQVSGQTVSATASLIPGAAASGVVVAGQTVAVTASLIAGAVTASSQANGSSLLVQASLLAGGVAADSQAAGALLSAAASLIPGSASGLASATVNGQTLSATASLLPGAASSGSGGAGGPFFVRHAPSPRKVIRISP